MPLDDAQTPLMENTRNPLLTRVDRPVRNLHELISEECGLRVSKTVFELAFEDIDLLEVDMVISWLEQMQAITVVGESFEGYLGRVWEVDRVRLESVVRRLDEARALGGQITTLHGEVGALESELAAKRHSLSLLCDKYRSLTGMLPPENILLALQD